MEQAINRYLTELKKDASWRKPQNGSTFFNSGYVDYLDENFEPQQMILEGDLSELLQHEYDHLDGILATMRAVDNKSLILGQMKRDL